jgi:fused signal recognition particle receptor
VRRKELNDPQALYAALKEELVAVLRPVSKPLIVDGGPHPYTILLVGVNGAGKTTTIGKLAPPPARRGQVGDARGGLTPSAPQPSSSCRCGANATGCR